MAAHSLNTEIDEAKQLQAFFEYRSAVELHGVDHPLARRCRNKIAEANRGLVHRPAESMANSTGETKEDFEQVGMIGLLRAVERFEPSRGNRFASFAIPFIRGEMLHHVRDNAIRVNPNVKRSDREFYYRVAKQHREALLINPNADIDTIALSARKDNGQQRIDADTWFQLRATIEGGQVGELNEEIAGAAKIEEARQLLIGGYLPTLTRQCLIEVVIKQSETVPFADRVKVAAYRLKIGEEEVEQRTKKGLDSIRNAVSASTTD